MKKKTSWKTIVGLTAATAAFLRFSKSFTVSRIGTIFPPTTEDIKPDCGPDKKPQRFFDTDVDAWSWRCVPKAAVVCQPGYVWDVRRQQCIPEDIGL